MTEEMQKLRSPDDLRDGDGEKYLHYQALTLEDPDEVWMEETDTGERHYTFISQFSQGDKKIYYIVVCLALDGTPSFVFLRFATGDQNLVDEYRRGTDMRRELSELPEGDERGLGDDADMEDAPTENPEEVAEGMSDLERLYQELRQPGDIPRNDFPKYENYIEPTLDDPDEIWQLIDAEGNEWYTFIAHHRLSDEEVSEHDEMVDDFTMIVVCEPGMDENSQARSFEVVFAFPSIDPGLVQHFRKGINSLNKTFGMGWARARAA